MSNRRRRKKRSKGFVRKRRTIVPPVFIDPQPQAVNELVEPIPQEEEQSLPLVMEAVLGELAPQEEVAESESGTGEEPAEA